MLQVIGLFPFGGKKGTSLVRKATSKAKKVQAKQKRNKLGEKDTGLEKKIQGQRKRYRLGKKIQAGRKKDTGQAKKKIQGVEGKRYRVEKRTMLQVIGLFPMKAKKEQAISEKVQVEFKKRQGGIKQTSKFIQAESEKEQVNTMME